MAALGSQAWCKGAIHCRNFFGVLQADRATVFCLCILCTCLCSSGKTFYM